MKDNGKIVPLDSDEVENVSAAMTEADGIDWPDWWPDWWPKRPVIIDPDG